MPSYSGAAGALDAVRDAIGLYMGLRQEKFSRERQLAADSRAERQLSLQADAAKRDAAQLEETKAQNSRRSIEYLIQNFGGERISPETATRARGLGYGDTLEQEHTIRAEHPSLPVSDTDPNLRTIATRSEPMPTGHERFKQPESERVRLQQMRDYTSLLRGREANASRERVGAGHDAVARERMNLQKYLGEAALQLRQYGIDVSSYDKQVQLQQTIEAFGSRMSAEQYQLLLQGIRTNPLSIMQFIGGQNPIPAVPDLTPDPYWSPLPLPATPTRPQPGGPGRSGKYIEEPVK